MDRTYYIGQEEDAMILSSKNIKLILLVLAVSFLESLLSTNLWAETINRGEKGDCVGCVPKVAYGSPVTNNKGLENIVKVAKSTQTSDDFVHGLTAFCITFEQLEGVYDFKKKLTEPMKKSSYSIDKYWQEAGCQLRRMGATESPIVHLVAENAVDRKEYLEALYKYYNNERKDRDLWLKAVNAKNTRGQTLLDYIEYMRKNNLFINEEKPAVNELIVFLCDNGAVFSENKNIKCPMRI